MVFVINWIGNEGENRYKAHYGMSFPQGREASPSKDWAGLEPFLTLHPELFPLYERHSKFQGQWEWVSIVGHHCPFPWRCHIHWESEEVSKLSKISSATAHEAFPLQSLPSRSLHKCNAYAYLQSKLLEVSKQSIYVTNKWTSRCKITKDYFRHKEDSNCNLCPVPWVKTHIPFKL